MLRELKARLVGEVDVAGPDLARSLSDLGLSRSLSDLGLFDEYRLYFRPIVLGHGTPFFAGPPTCLFPQLQFVLLCGGAALVAACRAEFARRRAWGRIRDKPFYKQ